MLRLSHALLLIAATYSFALAPSVQAARPSDVLLPSTTKGYVSVPDIRQLETKWLETQMGQLLEDPAMKPFVDDLWKQFKKGRGDDIQVSLSLDDLKSIAGGEVSLAKIQPAGDKKKHATALLVDVAGQSENAKALIARLIKELTEQGATKKTVKVGEARMEKVVLPPKKGKRVGETVYIGIHNDLLISINHLDTLKGILSRTKGEPMDSLTSVEAYRVSMQRSKQAAGERKPDLRWFLEPFGFIEVARAESGSAKKRGPDFLKVLSNTGFRAIQGGGGHVMLSTGEHEVLHYSFAYAPGEFEKAAKMLDFPNSDDLEAQPWVSRNGALYATFRWDLKNAFNSAKWIVDEIAGDPIFEDVLHGIKNDSNGPKIDVRKELVAYLSDRATLMTDNRLPITTDSERFVIAIEVTNPRIVQNTVNRAMEHDPQAKKREFGGHVIWEIINDEDDEDELDGPTIDGVPGLGGGFDDEEEDAMDAALPNSAVTVANNHLLIGSHVDYLRDFLVTLDEQDQLREAEDYQIVNYELKKIGAGTDSFRIFSRLDESLRATYELVRQNKMPESKSIIGKILNGMLGSEEEGVVRKQKIDGAKMPDYQIVRRYLGPMGIFVRTADDGWLATGCVLTKVHPEKK